MTAWLMTDLPEPDSPTSAVTLPGRTRRLARRTAWILPPSSAKVMLRSSIRNRSVPEAMRASPSQLARTACVRPPQLGDTSPASDACLERVALCLREVDTA